MILFSCVAAFLVLSTPAPGSKPTIEVKRIGGLCSDNQVCQNDIGTLYSDGTYTQHAKINKADLKKINMYIDVFNKSLYTSGDCGDSTLVGGDIYLSFPQKYGDNSFESCMEKMGSSGMDENQIGLIIDILNKY